MFKSQRRIVQLEYSLLTFLAYIAQSVEKTRQSKLCKWTNAKPKAHSPVLAVPVWWPRWSGWLCGGAWRWSLGCSAPLRTPGLSSGRGRPRGVGSESREARSEAGRDPHPARTQSPGRPGPATGLAESNGIRAWRISVCCRKKRTVVSPQLKL